ncbi:dihydroorotate dehydrogenase electron transfer subunit [Natranaerobius thermophilus]|uniref:Dihydroorotate dehydrogenase B (NAD(+)), electron transfer subunit n=1 Tax=Natranaerobius thermophilus (strain ATCC BAA-1301 / DSM 18059 / JW/NM-WN-LF) TaxID=457570 RepID=B2A2U5_NATTJ|nr:dihydroorotate dehydrogenase electron transfer subunit [Natranaerobius thermophilus]ACB86313.1 oxidoreductase FAD/NAD(P)-binding domain protein [Natranaerobius thermophilus JW/NM-WN-LF]
MWYDELGKISYHTKIAPQIFLMKIKLPKISTSIHPGQFVNIQVNGAYDQKEDSFATIISDPLLRRPISVYDVCPQEGELSIMYQVVGRGTQILSSQAEGTRLKVMGPLGNGFSLDEGQKVALVSGGIGIAPLYLLSKKLASNNCQPHLLAGFSGEEQVRLLQDFHELNNMNIKLATDDGSAGYHGQVTDLLKNFLSSYQEQIDMVVTCGPEIMMKKVVDLATRANLPVKLSVERKMACGVGACLGCTCESVDNQSYKHACIDGPVFWGNEVKLNG